MPHKCDDCFWRTDWEDETGPYPICERLWYENFETTKAECEKPGECEHKLLDKEAERIAERLNEIPN